MDPKAYVLQKFNTTAYNQVRKMHCLCNIYSFILLLFNLVMQLLLSCKIGRCCLARRRAIVEGCVSKRFGRMYELHKHRAKVQICKTTCKLDPLNGLQFYLYNSVHMSNLYFVFYNLKFFPAPRRLHHLI